MGIYDIYLLKKRMSPAGYFLWNQVVSNRSPGRGFFLLNIMTMERKMDFSNTKLTPEKAYRLLRSEGMDITLEQAREILFFLRKLANIAVSNHLRTGL